MSTIKLRSEMTKKEFIKEFTEYFDYIYIRVLASKGGKTKLGHSKFFTEGSEVSVDKNITVAEFEKEATVKSGMEVTIYYQTKPEGKRSKYYPANKEDAKTTLADLEARVSDMDNIVSQKEFMANLVNGNKTKKEQEENFINEEAKSIIKWSVGELYTDDKDDFLEFKDKFNLFHNEYSDNIQNLLDDNYSVVYKKMTLSDSTVVEFSEDIELYSIGDDEYNWDSSSPIIFGINVEINPDVFAELLMNDFQDWHDGESIITFYVTIINGDDEKEYCYSWHYEDGYLLE